MSTFKFNLRDEVRDSISKFVGVIIARTEWTNGCVRYTVQPPIGADKKLPETANFDEADLVLVKASKPVVAKPAGGPRNNEPRSPVGR